MSAGICERGIDPLNADTRRDRRDASDALRGGLQRGRQAACPLKPQVSFRDVRVSTQIGLGAMPNVWSCVR
jgi:hypothetical protein